MLALEAFDPDLADAEQRPRIGGEGQATLGGLGVALVCLFIPWPHWSLALIGSLAAGAAFGAAWGFLPAWLQAKRGSHIVIDWKALGYTVSVSLRITLDKTVSRAFDDFIAAARAVPEVIEIQTFLGRVDVRLSLIARDLPDYQRIYREQVLTLPHIADIEALMTVATVKSDESLPL